jgi:hypothetical protein
MAETTGSSTNSNSLSLAFSTVFLIARHPPWTFAEKPFEPEASLTPAQLKEWRRTVEAADARIKRRVVTAHSGDL